MPQPHLEPTPGKEIARGRSRFAVAIWLNLAWREWHEHKGEAAVVTAIMLACVLRALIGDGEVVADFTFAAMVAVFATIFMAMSIVAGERADGSLAFVRSLPVERWKTATVRLLSGACLSVAPILVTGLVTIATMAAAGSNGSVRDVCLVVIYMSGFCLSLYFWITATAIHQPSQFRVGVVGVAVLFIWFSLAILFTPPIGLNPQPILPLGLIRIIEDIGPLGWARGTELPPGPPHAGLLAWQALVLCFLFAVSAANYGLPGKPSSARHVSRKARLGSPRRSSQSAIAWLNVAESLPVAIGGLALFLAVAFGFLLLFVGDLPTFASPTGIVKPLEIVSAVSLPFGILWMAIVAATLFVPSLQPALSTFWRSRPIDLSEWFWSKYWLGAVIGIGCLHAPTIAAISIVRGREWVSPTGELTGYACILLTHLMVYSVTVLAACLVRNVFHASILGFSFAVFVVGIPAAKDTLQILQIGFAKRRVTEFVENGLSTMSLQAFDFVPFILLMIVLVIGSALAAAHAVRRDIAYRQ